MGRSVAEVMVREGAFDGLTDEVDIHEAFRSRLAEMEEGPAIAGGYACNGAARVLDEQVQRLRLTNPERAIALAKASNMLGDGDRARERISEYDIAREARRPDLAIREFQKSFNSHNYPSRELSHEEVQIDAAYRAIQDTEPADITFMAHSMDRATRGHAAAGVRATIEEIQDDIEDLRQNRQNRSPQNRAAKIHLAEEELRDWQRALNSLE